MERLLRLSLLAFICILLFSACNQRNRSQNAINNLRDFVTKVEENASEFTEEDWNRCDAEYETLAKEIDRYRYSAENVHEIGRLKGKYTGIKSKYKGKEMIENVENAIEDIKGKIEGFKEGISGQKESPEENTN